MADLDPHEEQEARKYIERLMPKLTAFLLQRGLNPTIEQLQYLMLTMSGLATVLSRQMTWDEAQAEFEEVALPTFDLAVIGMLIGQYHQELAEIFEIQPFTAADFLGDDSDETPEE